MVFFHYCFSLLSFLELLLLLFFFQFCCSQEGKSLRKSGFRAISGHQDRELMLEKAKLLLHFL